MFQTTLVSFINKKEKAFGRKEIKTTGVQIQGGAREPLTFQKYGKRKLCI